ncbi:hypothetical protein D3C87_1112730 [compost metagenome]
MIKSISTTVISAAAILVAGTASAGITPNGTYSLGGAAATDSNLDVSQSVSLTGCKVNWANALTVSGGTATAAVLGKTLSVGSLCSGVSLKNNWSIAAGSTANAVVITGFWAKTLNGECGSATQVVNGTYSPTPSPRINISASVSGWYDVIPGIGPRVIKDCTINGFVGLSAPLTVVP